MKKLYIAICIVFLSACSKEKIQEQQEELIFQAITSGFWKVTEFNKGGMYVTADFTGYKFQFKTDYTMDAINNGNIESTGTWIANPMAQTITSTFSGATNPVDLLNGTWTISNSTWTSVNAKQTVGSELRTIRLDKL